MSVVFSVKGTSDFIELRRYKGDCQNCACLKASKWWIATVRESANVPYEILCDSCRKAELPLVVDDAHAISILHDLLNYGSREKVWDEPGNLNPTDVLVRLAMSDFRIESMVRPLFTYVDADVNVCPPEAALRLYVQRLTALAEKAQELDEDISYKTR